MPRQLWALAGNDGIRVLPPAYVDGDWGPILGCLHFKGVAPRSSRKTLTGCCRRSSASPRNRGRVSNCEPFLRKCSKEGRSGPTLRGWQGSSIFAASTVLSQAGILMGQGRIRWPQVHISSKISVMLMIKEEKMSPVYSSTESRVALQVQT